MIMVTEWGIKRLQDILADTKLKILYWALDKVDSPWYVKTALEMELS